ncbi:MAG: PEP-CTERM/exosortase system-associated acyltransferase [Desulfuromonadaceae bacterium]|nr:PEP-CTERM/exosortase system-associated acyltransferase [Desulfuromonas sp.]MDY0185186.1 PEP-CTERM/exosortase system-associated acyltransferase [Desulfuromonadaceae bacterium]
MVGVTLKMRITRYREMLLLHRHFKNYFKVVPAVNPELVRQAQRVRHTVYCEELGWEPVNENGLERDIYDDNALHCLLMSVRSGLYIGSVRLVLPRPGEDSQALPLQELCTETLYPGYPDFDQIHRGELAEVSRLAIVSDFRRRKNEAKTPVPIDLPENYSKQGRRRFPYIPVGLYIGMLEMASFYEIKTLYMLTEPMLAVHFSALGGNLEPIGATIEHRGKRRPYTMDVETVLKDANIFLRPLIWTIRKDVRRSLSQTSGVLESQYSWGDS